MSQEFIMRVASLSVCVGLVASFVLAQPAAAQTVIVRDGAAQATIVLPAEATVDERLAATELQTHVERLSGAKLPVAQAGAEANGVHILIGAAAGGSKRAIEGRSADAGAYRVLVTPARVELAGNSGDATQYAVYDLLHQLGVRWLIPGELGVDFPQIKTVTLQQQDLIETPAFRGRILQAIGDEEWARRNRLGGFNAGAHGLGPRFDRKARPDLFYHENGKPTGQEKVSEPEVLREVIAYWRKELQKNPKREYINVGPHDGAGFGEDPWDAGDFDPIMGKRATTDRYVKFFNLILEDLQKDYPNVGLAFYAYTQEMRPPVRETPNPRLLPMLAAIGLDRFHSIHNPLSWEKQYLKSVIEGWQAKGVRLMFRGYLFNLADHGLPFSMIDIVRDEWPYYHDKGFIAMRVECIPNWGYHAPALYLASRLFWDPTLNSDAVMNEWFERMYGPAATAMKEHFDLIENAYIHGDYYTGNVFDVPKILTPEVRKKMGATLASAEQAAGNEDKFAQRVKLVRIAYDYGEANFKMMDAFWRGDFVEARKHHDQIEKELIPAATATKPAVLSKAHVGYFKRFWSGSVTNAAERVTGRRELVVNMPDQWRMMLDPNGTGEQLFLFQPGLGTNAWAPIKTWSTSTSNQGLRYYRGSAWYRCSVKVPEKFAGRPMRVWFGGLDDTASVWANGKPLTMINTGAAPIGRPHEFDAGDTLRPGQDNVVVVKVSDNSVNELGTFGINGPAMIWAEPAEAAEATK
jgi:hypothetical protein